MHIIPEYFTHIIVLIHPSMYLGLCSHHIFGSV